MISSAVYLGDAVYSSRRRAEEGREAVEKKRSEIVEQTPLVCLEWDQCSQQFRLGRLLKARIPSR